MTKLFHMSTLQCELGIMLAIIVALIIFEIMSRWYDSYRIKKGIEKDRSLDNTFMVRYHKIPRSTFRILFEGLLFIGAGIMMILVYKTSHTYEKYGAFYDESWRMPDVEQHFVFDNTDTEILNGIYKSDPENFNLMSYPVCLVKLGCEDCELLKDTILSLSENIYVIFSDSEIGQLYVKEYGVNYVPCIISDNTSLPLYSDTDIGANISENANQKTAEQQADDTIHMIDSLTNTTK